MSNIFVDGANGFVGQRLLKKLLELNHTPIVLIKDYNRKTDEEIMKQVRIKGAEIRGDVRDKDLVRQILSKYEIDYVIHLAAMPIVNICDQDPWTAYNVNVIGTLTLMECIRDQMQRPNRLKKVINMVSDKYYGDSSPPGGYLEDTPPKATDTYCTSKICSDMISMSYAKTYNVPVCNVRCGNLYGGGDLNLSRLIPGTTLRLLNGEQPVLYTDAAQMSREFIHVDDMVNTYMLLLEKGVPGEAYNVGVGKLYNILDVINKIRERVNPDIDIRMVERNLFEIKTQQLNADKLVSLGWKQTMTLDDGLDEAVTWYTKWHKMVNK